MRFERKVALITGGAKGIGLGIARAFAREGAVVALVDIDEASGHKVEQELAAQGTRARFFPCDVGQSQAIQSTVNAALRTFGRIDVLVNNAGTHNGGGLEACSEEDWDFLINTNLRSAFLLTKYALPALKESRGSVINMGSMVGLVGQKDAVAYVASKGGLIAMTKALALDLGPYGIRVNAICPGFVRTPLLDSWIKTQPDPVSIRSEVDGMHPLGRIAEPEEIGYAALHLASAEAGFTTGVALPVEGGVTLGY